MAEQYFFFFFVKISRIVHTFVLYLELFSFFAMEKN